MANWAQLFKAAGCVDRITPRRGALVMSEMLSKLSKCNSVMSVSACFIFDFFLTIRAADRSAPRF
jgi:hypothetical protein